MFRTSRWALCLAALALWPLAAHALEGTARTPPTFLTINPASLQVEDVTFAFEVTMVEIRPRDAPVQIRLVTTITRTSPGQMVRFRDITCNALADGASVQIQADGRVFVLEACYYETTRADVPPRQVMTTFGDMFNGGRVGLSVRLGS
jgi:hypothetical protein